MPKATTLETQLVVLGAGMAGLSAALFARRRGLSTVVVGATSELVYASGPWDLLGVHPIAKRKILVDPWLGLEALCADLPQHPYTRLSEPNIRAAFAVLLEAFRDAGYPYERLPETNCEIITSLGTMKRTFCVPHTMWAGVEALQRRVPCLLVDFEGMKDFSARQIVSCASKTWPSLVARRLPFPGTEHLPEVSSDYLARCMDLGGTRERLAALLLPYVEDFEAIGFPAMLGYERTQEVVSDLESRLGLPVFEIPSPPVSMPGLRMKNTFGKILARKGCGTLLGHRAIRAQARDDGFVLQVGPAGVVQQVDYEIQTKGVLLATGRFLGGGLVGDRSTIREPLFNLPVYQPENRAAWHQATLLDPHGHALNQAGLEVDELGRPLGPSGKRAHRNLYAAGSILAHQDWMRSKSGSGIAIGTSYAAVETFYRHEKELEDEAR